MTETQLNLVYVRRGLIFICVPGKSRVTFGFRKSLIQDSLSLFPPFGSTWLILQTGFLPMMVSVLAGAPQSPSQQKGTIFFHSFGEKIPEGLQLAGLGHVPISEPITVARRICAT